MPFSLKQTCPSPPEGYTLCQGEYCYPFEIRFQRESECQISRPEVRHLKAVLPPSFEARAASHGAQAKIDYTLKVELKRPGRFQPRISTEQKLDFLPLDPSPFLITPSGSAYPTKQEALYISDLATGKNRNYTGRLPVLLLEAKLPSPAILYWGERLPLRLFVRNLLTLEDLCPIVLRSLVIILRSRTAIAAGIHHTSWTSSSKLLNLKGLKEVVSSSPEIDGLSEINDGIVQHATIPKVTPNFTTCTVEQKSSLEVEAGFTLRKETKLRVWCAIRNFDANCCSRSRCSWLRSSWTWRSGQALGLGKRHRMWGCRVILGGLPTVIHISSLQGMAAWNIGAPTKWMMLTDYLLHIHRPSLPVLRIC